MLSCFRAGLSCLTWNERHLERAKHYTTWEFVRIVLRDFGKQRAVSLKPSRGKFGIVKFANRGYQESEKMWLVKLRIEYSFGLKNNTNNNKGLNSTKLKHYLLSEVSKRPFVLLQNANEVLTPAFRRKRTKWIQNFAPTHLLDLSWLVPNSTPLRFVNSQPVASSQLGFLALLSSPKSCFS